MPLNIAHKQTIRNKYQSNMTRVWLQAWHGLSSASLLLLIASFSTTYYKGTIDVSAGRLQPEFGNILLYVSDIFLVGVVASWIIGQVSHPERRIRLTPWGLSFSLIILAVWGTLSLLWSRALPLTAGFALRLWLLLALYLLMRETSLRLRFWIEQIFIVIGIVQALVGLGQFLLQHQVGLAWAGELVRDASIPGAIVVQVEDRLWLRAAGLTSSPNALGALLSVAAIVLLGRYLDHKTTSFTRQLLQIAGILLLTAGVLATFTRAAWGGMAIGFALSFVASLYSGDSLVRRRMVKVVLCLLLVMFVVIATYWPLFKVRFSGTVALFAPEASTPNDTEQKNIGQRTYYHNTALALWRLHPWLGVGLANSSLAVLLDFNTPPDQGAAPVHSIPFLLLVELGPAGLLCWMGVAGTALNISWRRRSTLIRHPMRMAWSAALFALLFIGCFDHHFLTYQQGRVLLWMTMGLWAAEMG